MTTDRMTTAISKIPSVKLPEVLRNKQGYIKILLRYTTMEPKHIRSHILKTTYGFSGPYIEETCVLLPQEKVMPDLLYFAPTLTWLQVCGIVSKTAVLRDFVIKDEDNLTLAYTLD
jgi:hypothetical protein